MLVTVIRNVDQLKLSKRLLWYRSVVVVVHLSTVMRSGRW